MIFGLSHHLWSLWFIGDSYRHTENLNNASVTRLVVIAGWFLYWTYIHYTYNKRTRCSSECQPLALTDFFLSCTLCRYLYRYVHTLKPIVYILWLLIRVCVCDECFNGWKKGTRLCSIPFFLRFFCEFQSIQHYMVAARVLRVSKNLL